MPQQTAASPAPAGAAAPASTPVTTSPPAEAQPPAAENETARPPAAATDPRDAGSSSAPAEPAPAPKTDPGSKNQAEDKAKPNEKDKGKKPEGKNAAEKLVEAAEKLLGDDQSKGQGNTDQMTGWREAARETPALTAELANAVLSNLQGQDSCNQHQGDCLTACDAIASDCKPCSSDARCAALFVQVCAGQAQACTSGIIPD